MIKEQDIQKLVNQAIEGTNIFPVSIKVSSGNKITVLIDEIPGLPISDCVKVSRFIERSLDRDVEDFALSVSSPGLDMPFVVPKQYEKNIGRSIRIKLVDLGVLDGVITAANADAVQLNVENVITSSEALEGLKKESKIGLQYEYIAEAKVNIKFK